MVRQRVLAKNCGVEGRHPVGEVDMAVRTRRRHPPEGQKGDVRAKQPEGLPAAFAEHVVETRIGEIMLPEPR